MSDVAPYTDQLGRTQPGDGLAGPGHSYLGNLNRGRVAYDTTGRRLKVIAQGEGSTTVRRTTQGRSFRTSDGRQVTIRSGSELVTLARGTIVRARGGAS